MLKRVFQRDKIESGESSLAQGVRLFFCGIESSLSLRKCERSVESISELLDGILRIGLRKFVEFLA